MEGSFSTLQDFFTFTKGMIYILIVVILLVIGGFWHFLNENEED